MIKAAFVSMNVNSWLSFRWAERRLPISGSQSV